MEDEFDDIIDDMMGEFDDLLGPDVPEQYRKSSINKRLIEAYEKILRGEMEKNG